MKTIPLTQGKFALVDDEDFERLSKYHWTYDESNNRAHRIGIMMSHAVIQADNWLDHRDGNGLNNQKSNLRLCTRSQNQQNQRKQKRKTSSKYKGVHFYTSRKKWQAYISFLNILGQKIKKHLGYFMSEKDAARAYDEAARFYHKEFAALNFPKEGEISCIR